MEINKKTAQLVSDLESIIGRSCYNGDSYNGYTNEYGAKFRYPVNYLDDKGEIKKTKYDKPNLDFEKVDQMHYKFGANQLYIGAGIIRVLNELENRYGIDFTELTKNDEIKQEEFGGFTGYDTIIL